MTYTIVVTEPATQMAEQIKDVRIRRKLYERIKALAENPELHGKPLCQEFLPFSFQVSAFSFSFPAVGQKYRIIYRVERGIVTVLVVALGKRQSKSKEDIYELTRKLLKLGLIDLPK